MILVFPAGGWMDGEEPKTNGPFSGGDRAHTDQHGTDQCHQPGGELVRRWVPSVSRRLRTALPAGLHLTSD